MRTLDELVIAITLGTSEASEAKAAFADYLAEQLEARIKASLRELHALDMSEIETWLGDDDPGGYTA